MPAHSKKSTASDLICGIDPGINGALAFLTRDLKLTLVDIPKYYLTLTAKTKKGNPKRRGVVDANALFLLLAEKDPKMVGIELVQVGGAGEKFQRSAASIQTTGVNYGIVLGILTALEIPYFEIKAREWQKATFGGRGKTSNTKEMAYHKCCSLFPRYAEEFKTQRGRLLDGRCDAALIAYYTLEKLSFLE